jgi:FAD/FMN-containing dehydrogenase
VSAVPKIARMSISHPTLTSQARFSEPRICLPGATGYDSARQAWNLAADQRPAAVCVARSIGDVQFALAYAREHGLTIAAQTTGHLAQALPPLERTLLLRTELHGGRVDVDPRARLVRFAAGARWGDIVGAVADHGLSVMHGSSPSVGAVGYLLGGGLSFYGRAHGLAANHVRAFDVVTPDGVARRVDAGQHQDLFWALRGGGGNTAVVCGVELGLLPYSTVTGGALCFAADDAFALLRAWRDWCVDAPASMTTTFRILCLPPLPEVPAPLRGTPTVCIDGVSLDPEVARRLELRLKGTATPVLGGFGPMPSSAVARLHQDPEAPVPAIGDGMLLRSLDDWAIDSFLRVANSSRALIAHEIRHLGGALASPPPGSGARGGLEGEYLLFGVGVPGAPAPAHEIESHLDRLLGALQPWASGTRFASFAERQSSMAGCLPDESLARLRAVRDTYDPDRLLVPAHAA